MSLLSGRHFKQHKSNLVIMTIFSKKSKNKSSSATSKAPKAKALVRGAGANPTPAFRIRRQRIKDLPSEAQLGEKVAKLPDHIEVMKKIRDSVSLGDIVFNDGETLLTVVNIDDKERVNLAPPKRGGGL
jgi:hypothetical protein